MSWSWYVYTTRAPSDVLTVEAELETALAEYADDHDVDDAHAEAGAGGPPPPKPEEVIAYRARFREVVAADVLERLAPCVMDWGDLSVELG